MEEKTEEILEKRKKKIASFLKEKKDWVIYLVLAFIVWLSVFIRSRNIPKLKDITTGTWTLGPDLDPFLFLRWAQEVVATGGLAAQDMMRNVPIGFNTAGEMKLLAYLIVWFYDVLCFFSKEVTVTYAAVVFPVVMAGLTAVAFFLFAREIFYRENKITKNAVALLATGFFVLVPSMLARTIAGIPEKESAAFFFMFIAFYFFLKAFHAEKLKKNLIFGVLAGISTAGMALIWGGVIFVFFTVPATVLIAFILGKIRTKEFLIYAAWLITSFILMMPFSARYALKNLIMSTSTGFAVGVLVLIGLSMLILKNKKLNEFRKKIKLPKELSALIISGVVLIILVIVILGPDFVFSQIKEVKNSLITPIQGRWNTTVAENKQPYFGDWRSSFGPLMFNIPLYFWLFFLGAVYLFNNLIKKLSKKERVLLTASYFVFLFFLIFSRYSSSSILDGTSGLSLTMYFSGWIIFLGSFGYFYYQNYKNEMFEKFREINFAYILYFIVFTLALIGARGGIRLIMVLGAVSPIAISFLVVGFCKKYFKEKEDSMKFFIGIIAIILILASVFTLWNYYKSDKATAENFAPSYYQWQWQNAMEWVRDNTAATIIEDETFKGGTVFAHWWDYGYWVQSIGERATVLDGGNAIALWNYYMGRVVLTGDNQQDALDFLYVHNATHLLIDSTDIGKYGAFSSIGSDEDYDRYSWIATITLDESQTRETGNSTIYFYMGGIPLDEDLVLRKDDNDILLPAGKAYLGAIVLSFAKDSEGNSQVSQPYAIFVYQNKQFQENLRYVSIDQEFVDFGSGIEATAFVYPLISGNQIKNRGALMYLSPRVMRGYLAQKYVLDDPFNNFPNFEIAHTEQSFIVSQIEAQGTELPDFIHYEGLGLQGPIKIWEVKYTGNEEVQEKYLDTDASKYLTWKL